MEDNQPIQSSTVQKAKPNSSTNSIMSLILGILSLACCGFFAGIPAILLGRSELKAISEGRVDVSNQTIAKVGMILGIIGTVLSCLGSLIYITMIALMGSAAFIDAGF